MAFLGSLDALADETRTRKSGIEHRAALLFEPFLEQHDLRRTAHAVGAFDHNQLAHQAIEILAGKRHAVRLFHGVTLNCRACVSLASTNWRICCCCVSMGRVASITVNPNSGTIFSYSSRMRF